MNPTQTTPTNGRPTMHPDWQETSERIYRLLYPIGRISFSSTLLADTAKVALEVAAYLHARRERNSQ